MKKLTLLLGVVLLLGTVSPIFADEFTVNGVLQSNVCSDSKGHSYKYSGYFGKVGTPCLWYFGTIEYTGVFGG